VTRRLGLIVTGTSPLITLAAGEALECLTMPGLRVIIPDMVYFEVTQDLARTGGGDIVGWVRRHHEQVEIAPTEVFGEFQVLRAVDAKARSKGRGEQSAAEILNAEIERDPDLEALLLYEDNDIKSRRFLGALPERVTPLSTGDLLRELEAAGRIQSADHILDVAAEKERNVDAQRRARGDDDGRALVRQQLAATGNVGRNGDAP
jgi:hypothetical protein